MFLSLISHHSVSCSHSVIYLVAYFPVSHSVCNAFDQLVSQRVSRMFRHLTALLGACLRFIEV
jgi:hypothetical protein